MAFGAILGQTPKQEIPIGGIIIWSGAENMIPNNWHLCDGTNGTPDLRNRFVIGAGNNYEVGDLGGEASHVLSINEMPSHSHMINKSTSSQGGSGSYPIVSNMTAQNYNFTTLTSGGSQPHNNMPPYYALCYIMKIA